MASSISVHIYGASAVPPSAIVGVVPVIFSTNVLTYGWAEGIGSIGEIVIGVVFFAVAVWMLAESLD